MVHPDYAKRFNQARDIRIILTHPGAAKLRKQDRERLASIAADLQQSADLIREEEAGTN
jgi:hypothetical protein